MDAVTSKKQHFYFIDTLRAIACFFVVLHHTLIYSHASPVAEYYKQHLKLFFLTVPLYLTISGFVHTQNVIHNKQSYFSYVLDKVKRILVPYFVLSLITLGFRFATEYFHIIPVSDHFLMPFVGSEVLKRFFFAGIEGHYYFLLILFVYLLVFPAVLNLFKSRASALISFAVILVVDAILQSRYEALHSAEWTPWNLLVALILGIKFFYFGFVLQKNFAVISPILKRYGVLIGIVLTTVYAIVSYNMPARHEQWLFVQLLAYFGFAYALLNQRNKWVQLISSLSFGIYLLHQPYFIRLTRIELSFLHLDPNAQFELTAVIAFLTTALFVWMISSSTWISRLILGQKWGPQVAPAKKDIDVIGSLELQNP